MPGRWILIGCCTQGERQPGALGGPSFADVITPAGQNQTHTTPSGDVASLRADYGSSDVFNRESKYIKRKCMVEIVIVCRLRTPDIVWTSR